MPAPIISTSVLAKLATKHNVTEAEIEECFFNHMGQCVEDTREELRTDPATFAFISETNRRRKLKVVFILKSGNIHIKTAYEPNQADIDFYQAGQP